MKVSHNGTYLFVDVEISKETRPGDYPLTVKTKGGSAQIPFGIFDPLPRKEYFQGFSNDDIIYLLPADKFANGDPSNDDPAIYDNSNQLNKAEVYDGKPAAAYHGYGATICMVSKITSQRWILFAR